MEKRQSLQQVMLEIWTVTCKSMKSESESEAAQSCLTLCDSTRLLCPQNFLGKNTGVGCHFLHQEIFQTQGLNLGFLHCSCILYHLSHQGSSKHT